MFKAFLSTEEAQSYGNLGSTNDGLTIQVTQTNLHGSVSSLSQVSIENKKEVSPTFSSHIHVKKTIEYSQAAVTQLECSNIESPTKYPISSQTIDVTQQSQQYLPPSQRKSVYSMPLLPQVSVQSIGSSQLIKNPSTVTQQSLSKIEITKKSKYWEILEQCQKTNTPFTDTEFSAENKSLGRQSYIKKEKNYGGWERISKIVQNPVFVKKFDAQDALQGQIGNCYFVSAIASVAKDYPQMFDQVFVSNKLNEYGIYMARFYVEGILVEIVVDDYVPISKDKKPYYAKPSSDNEIWAMILEKCWAKLFKSYERIEGGYPQEVFYALTGSPYGLKTLQSIKNENEDQKRQQFIKLYKFKQKGNLFCCHTKRANSKPQLELLLRKGLVSCHAYSVLQLIIDPVCIVKLRNPRGYNKGQNEVNGYFYDWKTQLVKKYGQQNAANYLKVLNAKGIDLFGPQNDGIFHMPYEEFMNEFQSITVCQIRSDMNLLSLRSTFTKNKAKFFYFDLTKESPIVICMSQMFKKMEERFQQEDAYAVTKLILAKVVKKRKGQNQSLRKQSESLSDDVSLKVSVVQKDSLKQQSKISKSSQSSKDQQDEQITGYEFIAARSNNADSPFNFLLMDQKNPGIFEERTFQPGRYVIYASAKLKPNQAKKDCTMTIHSLDSSFPKEINNLQQLYPSKNITMSSLLGSIGILANDEQIEKKWLCQVLLSKALTEKEKLIPMSEYQNSPKQVLLANDQLDEKMSSQLSVQDSWYTCRIPYTYQYEKMGGFGYFICHLSKKHKMNEQFNFKVSQYYGRGVQIVTDDESFSPKKENYTLIVKPGQTKLVIFKTSKVYINEWGVLSGQYNVSNPGNNSANIDLVRHQTMAPMPTRQSISLIAEEKKSPLTLSNIATALSLPSFSR